MKKLLMVVLAGIMVFSMAACGSGTSESDVQMINVGIEIDYPDSAAAEDVEAELQVEEGTNAMDMLYQYADENNIEIVLDESSPTIYVTSIGGVEQAADAGWIYEANGEMSMDPADEYILEDGTVITWEYMSWSDFSE